MLSRRCPSLTAQLARLRRQAEATAQLAGDRHQEIRHDIADVRAEVRRDTEVRVAALRRDTESNFAEVGATLGEHAAAIERILDRQQRLPPSPARSSTPASTPSSRSPRPSVVGRATLYRHLNPTTAREAS